MSEWDEYYSSDNIPQRLKKRLSIMDMRELAKPLARRIEALERERDEAHAELNSMRQNFVAAFAPIGLCPPGEFGQFFAADPESGELLGAISSAPDCIKERDELRAELAEAKADNRALRELLGKCECAYAGHEVRSTSLHCTCVELEAFRDAGGGK